MNNHLNTCFEDEYYLAVNKPNNVLIHHSYYARNEQEPTLVEIVEKQFGKYYPIHRLDRKTSGVLLFAKQKEDVAPIANQFENNTTSKLYKALVRGFVDQEGKIDSPVKNDKGVYKEALTYYRLNDTFHIDIPVQPYPTSRYSFVDFMPKTGRMHQLRIHANKISHPIIGDHRYGNRHHNKMFEEVLGLSNLFLHAQQLTFFHPILEKEISITAELPAFWEEAFKKLKSAAINS